MDLRHCRPSRRGEPGRGGNHHLRDISPAGGTSNVLWTNSSGERHRGTFVSVATSSTVGLAQRLVTFSFLDSSLSPYLTGANAALTLDATAPSGNRALLASGFPIQGGIIGSFCSGRLRRVVVGTKTYAAGSNLLTGFFGGTSIFGQRSGTMAAFTGSTSAGDILTYTSDFLSFANTTDSDFSIALGAISPALNAVPTNGTPVYALRSFRAVASGAFSADPAPTGTAASAVPEPMTWAMMLAGFGLIGATLRSRRTRAASVRHA